MDLSHDRFDQQAVAHVMGGLSDDEATTFRAHLLRCPDCRARVRELRLLADDLEAAEREERAARGDVDHDGPPGAVTVDARRRWTFVLAAGGLLLLGLIAVWNQALRFDNTTLVGTAAVREQVLGVLGDGEAMPVETRADVTGVAALDRDTERLAMSLGGIDEVADMYRVVVWRDDGTAAAPDWVEYAAFEPDQLVGARLAMVVPVSATTQQVVVTVEQTVMPEVPNENPIVRIPLGG